MPNDMKPIFDLIYGHWNSRILEAGVTLGVFDEFVDGSAKSADALATTIGANATMLYRLLRAMANLGLLVEADFNAFTLSPLGGLFQASHPSGMRSLALLEGNRTHRAGWNHLVEMIRAGRQDGAQVEFGVTLWEMMRRDPQYGRIFQDAMSTFSKGEVGDVVEALRLGDVDLSAVRTFCDIAGGLGTLLTALLSRYPDTLGTCVDLAEIAEQGKKVREPNVANRLSFVAGDIFVSVPEADCYLLKNILHDWDDRECIAILSNARKRATGPRLLLICEIVITPPGMPHYSKLLDINMLCVANGRQRRAHEFQGLLAASGWELQSVVTAPGHLTSVVAARAVP